MDGSPPPEIDAPPMVLRSYRGDELPSVLEAVTASLDHLRPWLAWASAEPLEPVVSNFIRRSVAQFGQAEGFHYAIWDDVASLLVGGAGLHPRLGPGRIEIGYWVRDGWLRRGIATAATRALTSAAFTMPGIEEVHIHCDEANGASAAVPNRLGFRLAKIVDDEVDAPAEVGRSMEWVMSRANWLWQFISYFDADGKARKSRRVLSLSSAPVLPAHNAGLRRDSDAS
jgi:RimJ/RimL family protein N-acetyltransferase